MNTATLRPAKPTDAETIAAIYAPYVADTAISFEETPPTDQHQPDGTVGLLLPEAQ